MRGEIDEHTLYQYLDTYWAADSIMGRSSLLPPVFINSKPPPKLDKIASAPARKPHTGYLRHITHEICAETKCQEEVWRNTGGTTAYAK